MEFETLKPVTHVNKWIQIADEQVLFGGCASINVASSNTFLAASQHIASSGLLLQAEIAWFNCPSVTTCALQKAAELIVMPFG